MLFMKKRLELGHGTASGASYDQLNDAQDVEGELLPIYFHS